MLNKKEEKISLRALWFDLESKLLCIWLFDLFLLTIARFFLARLGIEEGLLRSYVLWCIASFPIIVFLVNIRKIRVQKYRPFCGLYFVIIISIVISLLMNPELEEYYFRENYGLDRILRPDCALYGFLFFSIFKDPQKILKNLTLFAYLDFIYLIIVELLPAFLQGYWVDIGPRGHELHLSYSLSFGYAMAFPTIVFIYLSLKGHKIYHIVLSVIGMYCILIYGNRGALALPLIFISIMTVSRIVREECMSKKMLKMIGIFLLIIMIAVFGEYITKIISIILDTTDISSRNVDMLLSGRIMHDNGRERIWLTVINAIQNGGWLGYGVLGDRPFVVPIHYVGYSHNLFLELIVSYGIIGAVISVYIIVDVVRMIFFCKDTLWRELYIIFFSVSFQLMLSMSFWFVWEFWAAAAIAHRYRHLHA